jgi:hypothetical protein
MAAVAVVKLASGEPPINFAAHQFRAGNIAGAREDFEQMLAMLVAAVYPGARLIAANPGDWGIDVMVGELGGVVVVWQAKYFWPAVTRPKQDEIRRSFAAAVAAAAEHGYRLRRWILCVPSSLDGPTAQWWDRWRIRKQRETGIDIGIWDETALRTALVSPDAAHVRRHFYDPYLPNLPPGRDQVMLRQLSRDAAAAMEQTLFVHQLRAAGHVEFAAAKHAFFNAELLVREISDKAVETELDALAEAEAIVHVIWEAHFNEACRQHPDDDRLPGLYPTVMREIRDSTHSFPALLGGGPVHYCGMLHRVVERRQAGWVMQWRWVAAEYDRAVRGEAERR